MERISQFCIVLFIFSLSLLAFSLLVSQNIMVVGDTMKDVQQYLFSKQDNEYRDFTLPLIPNVDKDSFIGVRLPEIRKYAKAMGKSLKEAFLDELPHIYHEENILHAMIISDIKDYDEFVKRVDAFLPHVANWSVCDTICNKHLTKYRPELIEDIYRWLKSEEIYRVRYAVKCLMNYYLSEEFKQEHLERVRQVKLTDYYVRMMVAWYLATGLAKNYDEFIISIEGRWFDDFTHNKAIQKAIESYRVSEDHKAYLRTLKVK